MNRAIRTILKIGGVVITIAGVACVVKWVVDEFFCGDENNNKENEDLDFNDEFEEAPEEHNMLEVDVNTARSQAAEEITLRHQEAAKAMKEMITEIEQAPKDDPEEADKAEGRLNFDDIDASLDKLFDEEE